MSVSLIINATFIVTNLIKNNKFMKFGSNELNNYPKVHVRETLISMW